MKSDASAAALWVFSQVANGTFPFGGYTTEDLPHPRVPDCSKIAVVYQFALRRLEDGGGSP